MQRSLCRRFSALQQVSQRSRSPSRELHFSRQSASHHCRVGTENQSSGLRKYKITSSKDFFELEGRKEVISEIVKWLRGDFRCSMLVIVCLSVFTRCCIHSQGTHSPKFLQRVVKSTYHDKDILPTATATAKQNGSTNPTVALLHAPRLKKTASKAFLQFPVTMKEKRVLNKKRGNLGDIVCMPTLTIMPYSSHLLRGRWQFKQVLERNVFPRSIHCQGHMKKARRCTL